MNVETELTRLTKENDDYSKIQIAKKQDIGYNKN